MSNKIELATYIANIEVDQKGLTDGLKEADKTVLGGVDKISSGIKSSIAKIGLGAAALKVAKDSVKAFATVEEEMNKVFTLLPEMSREAQDEMTKQARELSLEVGKLPEETIPAIYSALSAGVPKDNVFDYVEVASKAAVAGGAETEETVEGLAAVLNAYNMDATEAEKVSDMFFVTLKNGMTSIPELSASLSNVTPIAAAMGVEFHEVAGALATMTAQGIPTSQATNQIKAMLAELNKEGSVSSDIFEEISGKSFPEFIEGGGSLQEALAMMDQHAEESNTTISNLFGSLNAGQGALALTGQNMESFVEDIDSMKNSAGATDEAFEKMNQGINRTKEILEVTVNEVLVKIGEVLAPMLNLFLQGVLAGLKVINVALDAIIPVVAKVVDFVVERVDKLKERLEQFQVEHSEVLEAIAEVVSTISEQVYKLVSVVLDKIAKVMDAFHAGAEDGVNHTWEAILDIIKRVLDMISNILNVFIAVFTGDWELLWTSVKELATNALKLVADIVLGGLQAVVGILAGMLGAFLSASKELFGAIFRGAKEIMGKLLKWITTPIRNIIRAFTSKFGEARGAGRGMFSAVWDGMKGIWGSISSWVIDKVNWLTDKLSFWKRSNDQMNTSQVGGGRQRSFAVGTPFVNKDQPALIHRGEAIIPARYNPFTKGGHFKPEFAGAGGDGNVTYDVDVNIDRVERDVDIEKAVDRGIERAENRRKRNLKKRGI